MNAAMAAAGNQGLGYTTVPMGWNRTIWGDGSVVYVSPSGHLLHCADELQRYLLAEGTCKCGLECPLIIDRVFNFNPRVPARPKLPSDILQRSHLQTLCKHRHKLVAMAAGLQGNEESLTNIGPPGEAWQRLGEAKQE
ncbi:methyl-CpG-binding domain protein 5-like [Asterias rubens]|uniref:methyl-CpG-binding domain protein 5-like n=1 Tax=Asterias rubens TaxID=7604 RepID=UPI0014550326|nr:methyl-CpG-binding domain protein 5-like [Asterias rubens]